MSLRDAGAAADAEFRAQRADDPVRPCKQKTWIEVELVDQDGKRVPNERFRIELSDGRVIEGRLDADGLGGVDGIDPAEGVLTFPDILQRDAELVGSR